VERLSDPAMLAHVRQMGDLLRTELETMSARTGRIRAIRGVGLMVGVDVTEPAADIIARAREHGLLLVSAGEHTLRLLPPLVIGEGDLKRGLELLEQALVA
jgi:acetylornithine/succinyldiaminopimelate/putrescine aminotransferase